MTISVRRGDVSPADVSSSLEAFHATAGSHSRRQPRASATRRHIGGELHTPLRHFLPRLLCSEPPTIACVSISKVSFSQPSEHGCLCGHSRVCSPVIVYSRSRQRQRVLTAQQHVPELHDDLIKYRWIRKILGFKSDYFQNWWYCL